MTSISDVTTNVDRSLNVSDESEMEAMNFVSSTLLFHSN